MNRLNIVQRNSDVYVEFNILRCFTATVDLNVYFIQSIKVSALTIEDGAQAVRFPHARVASEL